jgi:hypothetical protein
VRIERCADTKAGLSSGVGLLPVRGSPVAVGLIEQHLLVVDLPCAAGVSQPGLLEHALRRDMVGFDDSDDVLEAERAEGLPHDLARGLGRQPTSPRAWMKVVAEFDLWTAMLEWLQPTVADQSSALAILDGPEAETRVARVSMCWPSSRSTSSRVWAPIHCATSGCW